MVGLDPRQIATYDIYCFEFKVFLSFLLAPQTSSSTTSCMSRTSDKFVHVAVSWWHASRLSWKWFLRVDARDVSGFVRLFLILTGNKFLAEDLW